jgi:hypothetical protein
VREIAEDENAGTVTVDGFTFDGFIDDGQHYCGSRRVYSDDFDAYCCPACNEWLKFACGDKSCGYCAHRPDKPFPSST